MKATRETRTRATSSVEEWQRHSNTTPVRILAGRLLAEFAFAAVVSNKDGGFALVYKDSLNHRRLPEHRYEEYNHANINLKSKLDSYFSNMLKIAREFDSDALRGDIYIYIYIYILTMRCRSEGRKSWSVYCRKPSRHTSHQGR